jgi:hydrophobe/amphiphile efflux-3 (HAE3) family protein
MRRVLHWFLDHPVPTIAGIAALTLFFALQIPRLEVDPSAEGLMVAKDPARAFYEETKQRFGSDQLTIVLVKAPDVFAAEVLQTVRRLSDGLARLEGVARVESLTTVRNIKGEGDTLDTEPVIGTVVPSDPAALARIRRDALGNRVFVGNVVAADARATAITVYTESRRDDGTFDRRFTDAVEALIARESAPGLRIYQVGSPLVRHVEAENLRRDQTTVIPISIAVLLGTLLLAFRTPQGVVIPTATALISIVWAMGLMAVTGIPVNMLTAIVPSLLIAIGFTEDVHMIADYHHRLAGGLDRPSAVRAMIDDSAVPILVTTGTTVIGFGSLVTTDITMMIQFGYASAMGLTANFLVTIALLPTMLRVWPVPRRLRRSAFGDRGTHGVIPRLMDWLGRANVRYRVPILIVAGVLAAGSLVGWLTLKVNNDLLRMFPEDSVVRTRVEDVHRTLGGALNFYVVVDAGRPDGAKDPDVLRRIAGLQEFLARTGKVDKTVSVADYVRTMHREMNGGDPAFEVVPDDGEQVAQYLLTLEGKELGQFLDFTASAANIVVRHNLTGSWDLAALRRHLDAYVAEHFPRNVQVRATGESILTNDASDYLAINELTSFSLTFAVIGIVHALLFMSLKAGLLSLIPNVLPILYVYGLMGLVGIPLHIGTALIATVAIGIAVDDTVHHMVTYSRELRAHHDQKLAMFNTLRTEGRPIVYVSLALAAGFLVLVFSSLLPTRHFGILAALVMLVALVGELTITPILMYSTNLVTLWDLVLLRMNREMVRAAPLFYGLSTWEARKVVLLGELRSVAAGETIITKGEAGTDMYMVVTGRVRAFDRQTDGREKVLNVLEPGAVFGEMALLTQRARSVYVEAEVPSDVLRLDFDALERIRSRFPYTGAKLFRNLARILSDRVRQLTVAVVEANG